MPRDASGSFSLVAGNPVITGTSISTAWANDTLSDIAQAITESLSRNGEGGMLVPMSFTDGNVTVPGIAFTNQSNTGFFRAGSRDVRTAAVTLGVQDAGGTDGSGFAIFDAGGTVRGSMLFDASTGIMEITRHSGTGEEEGIIQFLDSSIVNVVGGFSVNGVPVEGSSMFEDMVTITGEKPTLKFVENDFAAENSKWALYTNNGVCSLAAMSEGDVIGGAAFIAYRNGTEVTNFNVTSTLLQHDGVDVILADASVSFTSVPDVGGLLLMSSTGLVPFVNAPNVGSTRFILADASEQFTAVPQVNGTNVALEGGATGIPQVVQASLESSDAINSVSPSFENVTNLSVQVPAAWTGGLVLIICVLDIALETHKIGSGSMYPWGDIRFIVGGSIKATFEQATGAGITDTGTAITYFQNAGSVTVSTLANADPGQTIQVQAAKSHSDVDTMTISANNNLSSLVVMQVELAV